MNHSLFVMEADGASRSQTAPPAHIKTEEDSTPRYSSWAPEASSSTFERAHLNLEAVPSVVGESATANSRNPPSNSRRDRILQKKARIQQLLDQLRAGRSADPYFAYYEQQLGDMASTRSGHRGKTCVPRQWPSCF